ncbi:MAG TPA: MotA/TolQ/ExbB proton channel family protein [Candidatus Syntrophosphaera thermopropionivorans]|jgi:biopolymer transport protein ExbB|nr:MotA/TolQ/ExbB proton channel family protein [Candidatus Syntrophosphaera thermopropionivorans]HNZ45436.1 MotA/TolQ/ExbB proton channel family protein [Candidatus Syntrophosphaera thermopropionivorans]HOJ41517.1 MotA/TolQ/ExbB proton channel family protein [Candidatus Syntrophosphaera thermopropionivorans]HOL33162.1 MotA/TolQ/ExbB proton channel family protein [Candidatus Syntrophosphaera thermopropionivorans]HOQ83420.1 MotA/TolQ/ExbB proton channel family protein [Candidatus Syntrophosphaer
MRNRISKILPLLLLMSVLLISLAYAQDNATATAPDTAVTTTTTTEQTSPTETEAVQKSSGLRSVAEFLFGRALVQEFLNGGWAMWPILAVFIYGIAYSIWKFISLMYAKINLNDFLNQIVPLIKEKKIKEAIETAKKTRGPVAAVVFAGLEKAEQGIEAVEKNMENAAMIEMSYLEKGFVEMTSTIAICPMLGFLGTVDGMIIAFDAISKARAVDATIVADGIKVALITTKWGLISAIPVQLLYNIFTTMVDGIVVDMQRASEKVTEALIEA